MAVGTDQFFDVLMDCSCFNRWESARGKDRMAFWTRSVQDEPHRSVHVLATAEKTRSTLTCLASSISI